MCCWICLCQKFTQGQDNGLEAKNVEKYVPLKYSWKQLLWGKAVVLNVDNADEIVYVEVHTGTR